MLVSQASATKLLETYDANEEEAPSLLPSHPSTPSPAELNQGPDNGKSSHKPEKPVSAAKVSGKSTPKTEKRKSVSTDRDTASSSHKPEKSVSATKVSGGSTPKPKKKSSDRDAACSIHNPMKKSVSSDRGTARWSPRRSQCPQTEEASSSHKPEKKPVSVTGTWASQATSRRSKAWAQRWSRPVEQMTLSSWTPQVKRWTLACSPTGRWSWTMEKIRTGNQECAPRTPPRQLWGGIRGTGSTVPEGMLDERGSPVSTSQAESSPLSSQAEPTLLPISVNQPGDHPADQPGAQPVDWPDHPISPWKCHQPPTLLCSPGLVPATGESSWRGIRWGLEGCPKIPGGGK